MGDTFAVVRTLENAAPASAVIVGGGYIGLEMADALTVRGLRVTQIEQLTEVLPTVDPELGALVHAELAGHGVEVLTGTAVQAIIRAAAGQAERLEVQATAVDGTTVTRAADMVLVVVGVRPDTALAAGAGATLGVKGAIAVDQGMRTNLPDVFAAGDCVVTHHRLLGQTYLPLGAPSRRKVADAAAQAARRLERGGADLAGYTVAEVLADIEDLRTALGYDQIDLLSESYGTRLALLYAQTYPQRVHRSVLLGVNPPGRFVWDPAIVDSQLADWGRMWAASGSPGRSPDLAQTIKTGLDRLPRRWLGRRLDPGKAKILTFALLFQRRTALVAIDAWEAAARGDPSGVALLTLACDLAVPRLFTWGDFLAKAFSIDYEPGADYATVLDPPGAALGSPLSLLFFGGGTGWPPTPAPGHLRHLRDCDAESLLVGGALDLSTPPQHARNEALPHLPRGTQVIIPNASHVDDMWGLQPEPMNRLVSTFLDTGQAEAGFDPSVPALEPPLRLPAVARLGAGALLTVSAALAIVATRHWTGSHHERPVS
jgi:pimeloyl-ACP methyl ester carboxylesterase